MTATLDMALHLHKIGITPVLLRGKFPIETGWPQKKWSEDEIKEKFGNGAGIGAACGTISGGLENIDFDAKGEAYSAWVYNVEAKCPGLINRLAIEKTPSGGYHVHYFCSEITIPGNTKLACKRVEVSGPGEHEYKGKKIKAKEDGGAWVIWPELIETRGTGGQVAICPSPGYAFLQPGVKSPYLPPKITAAEREILIDAARSFDERQQACEPEMPRPQSAPTGDRPGDQITGRQVYDLLVGHGWEKHSTDGDRVYLTRPGKNVQKGRSATLYSDGGLYCFSSNADPFGENQSYSGFAVYTMLEHNGDFKAAARALAGKTENKPKKPENCNNPHNYNRTDMGNAEEPGAEATPQSCGISMLDLCRKEFPPVLWLLSGIFPSGSLYLAGPPKLGKSVFITNLAVAVATDGRVYGDHLCGTGDAIYLAMEDNERRLKNRIIANLGQRKPTDRLKLITMLDRWPVLGEGCLTRLKLEIDARPNTRLVIIDTLKRIRPKTNGTKKQQYDSDYDDLTRIHSLTADYPAVLFVIIGHTRKMAAEDIYDTISGTQGLSGAVDTLAVFAGMRGVGKAKLYVDGRDVMGVKKSVVYDKSTWSWKITGDISDIEATQNQDSIFASIKRYGKKDGLTPTDISSLAKVNKETVKKQLYQWLESEVVEKKAYGRYVLSAGAEKAGSLSKMLLNNIEDSTLERYK